MGMKRSVAMGQGQRNFLLENKLLVRRPMPMATRLGRLQRDQEDQEDKERHRWEQCRHSMPTAASQARLLETQRRLPNGVRQVGATRVRQSQSQEKQIQTEDIWDEQFLNAALLKCCRRSEGDEPFNDDDGEDATACLRGTASNFELGRVAAMQHKRRLQDSCCSKKRDQYHQEERKEEERQQVVLNLAIPDITDVEQEPQLDQSLSARSNASSYQMPPTKLTAAASATAADGNVNSLHVQQEQEQGRERERQQLLLSEQQRVALVGAAQARQRELIWEYNRLPLSMGTVRVRRLKTQLEQQLDRIDSDLCMLNLPQMYHQQQARSVTANL